MKTPVAILAALVLASAAYFGLRPAKVVAPADGNPASLHQGSLTMQTEPTEVFKRALWRRPAPDDKILHAERREWTKDSTQGPAHWQWFLAIEPGAALKKWLREQNPFAVHPTTDATAPDIKGAPWWFPGDLSGYEIRTGGTTGTLVFLFSRNDGTFYATGSGTGFTPGAPETAKPLPVATASTGRLPLTPPPTTPKP